MYNGDEFDEDDSLGRQALPVAELPVDFYGEPEDGMQYLFMVRRDAKRLPTTTRAPNPYETIEPPRSPSLRPNVAGPASGSRHMPSEDWRAAFVQNFKNMRLNVKQPTIHVGIPSHSSPIPPTLDRGLWWAYFHGKPERDWNPPKRSKRQQKRMMERGIKEQPPAKRPRLDQLPTPEPDPSLEEGEMDTDRVIYNEEGQEVVPEAGPSSIASTPDASPLRPVLDPGGIVVKQEPPYPAPCMANITQLGSHSTLHLLRSFTYWLNHRLPNKDGTIYPLAPFMPKWIWCLLVVVEEHLSGEEVHILRELARGSIDVIRSSIESGASSKEQAPWWMIVTVVVDIWGQKDLWFDAEHMIQKLPVASSSA